MSFLETVERQRAALEIPLEESLRIMGFNHAIVDLVKAPQPPD